MPNYSHGTKVTLASAEEPPYLSVGTDVSAKYKGAFCEAKITEVNKHVKLRVLFDGCTGSYLIDYTDLKAGSPLETGTKVEARHPEKKQHTFVPATITKILDHSRYTVVFDDGDQCVLRRNSICLKSGKHFAESETLDQLPLTNPEHFGNPVKVGVEQQNSHNNNQNNGNQVHQASTKTNGGGGNNNTCTNNNNNNSTNSNIVGSGQTNNNNGSNGTSSATNCSKVQPNQSKPEANNDRPRGKASSSTAANPTMSSTPVSTPGGRGRGGGKGRKRRESSNQGSKQDTIDELGDSSQDSVDADISDSNVKYELIEAGTRLMVQYGKGKIQNVYEAKVNKIEANPVGRIRYFVHYLGWNNRYDEWITRNRIVSIVTDKENGSRDGRSRQHHHHSQPIDTSSSNTIVNSPASTNATSATTTTITTNTNSTTCNSVSTGTSSSKEQKNALETVKEKEVPVTKTRRSRQTENSQATAVGPIPTATVASTVTSAASTTSASTTVATISTSTATPVKRESRDRDQPPPSAAKTRRTRLVDASTHSSSNSLSSASSTTSSSAGSSNALSTSASTSSASATAQQPAATKDKDKEKDTKEHQPTTKEARLRHNNQVSMETSVSSNAYTVSTPVRETPAKTRRSRHTVESNPTFAPGASAPNSISSPNSRERADKEKVNDREKEIKQERESMTKEGKNLSSKQSEPGPQHSSSKEAAVTSRERDHTIESDIQPVKTRGTSRQPDNVAYAFIAQTTNISSTASNSSSSSSGSFTTSSTTTVASTTNAITNSINSGATATTTITSAQAQSATLPTRDRDKDTKEPPPKVRRSRHNDTLASNHRNATSSSACSNSSASSVASSISSSHSANAPMTMSSNLTTLAATATSLTSIKHEKCSELPKIDEPDCDKRISILQDKILAIRQTYLTLKTELADLDRRRKKPRLERSNSDHINFNSVTCRN